MTDDATQEPEAMRYGFDGFGYRYIDSGSGSDWRTRHSDAEPLYAQPQTDALKKARGAINGLLDIVSDYNLDSEQAGRAFEALHEIGTALAALEQSK
jgi:hypothetical protein